MNRGRWSWFLALILPILILSYNNCGQPTTVPQIKFEGVATGNPFTSPGDPGNTPPPTGWPKPPTKCEGFSMQTSDSKSTLRLSSSVAKWQHPQSLRAPTGFYSKVVADQCESSDDSGKTDD